MTARTRWWLGSRGLGPDGLGDSNGTTNGRSSAQDVCASRRLAVTQAVGGGAAIARAISSATDQRRSGRSPSADADGFWLTVEGSVARMVTGSARVVRGMRRRGLKPPRTGLLET